MKKKSLASNGGRKKAKKNTPVIGEDLSDGFAPPASAAERRALRRWLAKVIRSQEIDASLMDAMKHGSNPWLE